MRALAALLKLLGGNDNRQAMVRIGHALGMILAVAAAAALLAQLLSLMASGGYRPVALGSIWYSLHANSLVGFQALIEKGLSPSVWPPVAWLLQLPAWLVCGVLAAVLLLTCRPRRARFG